MRRSPPTEPHAARREGASGPAAALVRSLRVLSWRDLVQLNVGLAALALGQALMFAAPIGLGPWPVFHQGLAQILGVSVGTVILGVGVIVVAAGALLFDIRPGFGTLLNMALIGPWVDLFLALPRFPAPDGLAFGTLQFVLGLGVMGAGTGLYIRAGMGAGPRDALVLGLARLLGTSVRATRMGIEALVTVAGFALGGALGLGTALFVLGAGPLMQLFLRLFERRSRAA